MTASTKNDILNLEELKVLLKMEAKVFNALLKEIKYDTSAVERIYKEYAPSVKLYLSRRYGSQIDVDDIMHEVFFKLMVIDWSKYSEVKSPTSWLNKIADHLALDLLKKRRMEYPLENYEGFSSSFDIDSIIVANDVKSALNQLDRLTAQIIYLHKYEGYKFKDIAAQLSMSSISVRVRASRGYKKLKIICNKNHWDFV